MDEKYNGTQRRVWYGNPQHLYDSDAESRWAVFFDCAGIRYVPHPVTFKTGVVFGETEIEYTPDFYLCDFNVYCEVKPSNAFVENVTFQRKISAAMNNNHTPIGHGLMMLGPLNGFKSNDTKKRCIYGSWYKWCLGAIAKGEWMIGRNGDGNNETKVFLYTPDDVNGFPRYPNLDHSPDIMLTYSDNDSHASQVIYDAINAAQYARKNNLFTYEKEGSEILEVLPIEFED